MPNEISWEGHLAGFIAGTLIAIIFRKKGPEEKKYSWEIEEELEINHNDPPVYYN